jgi:hypothetical protein
MTYVGIRQAELQVRLDVNNVQAGYLAGCAGAPRPREDRVGEGIPGRVR